MDALNAMEHLARALAWPHRIQNRSTEFRGHEGIGRSRSSLILLCYADITIARSRARAGFGHESLDVLLTAISRTNGEVKTMPLFRILVTLCLVVGTAPTRASAETFRIGSQTTGTFAWQLDVIRRHRLAASVGLDLEISQFASPDAGKLALNGGSVDLAVVDWLWVARARALGAKLLFYPYSSAVGAIMVKKESPLRGIADLKGHVLAIAGGPLDKSWLIVQAAAARQGINLKRDAILAFGAPPLISQKLQQGEAEASLNFWNFCASLETQGYRRIYEVRDAEAALGLTEPVALIGYAFSEQFAADHRSAIDRFITAAQKADDIMLRSDQEWDALRPLMNAEDDKTFTAYRDRTREGIPRRSIDAEETDARALFKALANIGGAELVGPSQQLDPGLYYRPASQGD
jgi:NitT/TauT family transport system substrate-binding protein